MIKEFKEFAMRGNVLDMAVGITLLEFPLDLLLDRLWMTS